jgi:hypothetical protein
MVVIDYRDFQLGVPKLVNIERAVGTSLCTLAAVGTRA